MSIDWDEVVSIEVAGDDGCYDVSLLEDDYYLDEPNFIANGIVVHNCKMDDEFVSRKKGENVYELHPLLQPILGNTYGVICFQEQCMKIFNVVGDIPLEHCYNLIKAISKKKKEIFGDYKVQFIENGQKNLGWTVEEIEALWKQLEGFAGYAFNLCLTGDMLVYDKVGKQFYQISDLEDKCSGIKLDSYNGEDVVEDELLNVFFTGEKEVFEIEFSNGMKIKSTLGHKFLCSDGKPHAVEEILKDDLDILFTTQLKKLV